MKDASRAETKRRANKNETRVAKALGGKRVRNSGARPWGNDRRDTEGADGITPDFLFEHKGIDRNTRAMSIKREWLEQIARNAARSMKEPALVLTFEELKGPRDWVMVPLEVAQRLLGIQQKD